MGRRDEKNEILWYKKNPEWTETLVGTLVNNKVFFLCSVCVCKGKYYNYSIVSRFAVINDMSWLNALLVRQFYSYASILGCYLSGGQLEPRVPPKSKARSAYVSKYCNAYQDQLGARAR